MITSYILLFSQLVYHIILINLSSTAFKNVMCLSVFACVCMCAPLQQKEPGGSSSARGTVQPPGIHAPF